MDILLVEDDADFRTLLAEFLTEEGYVVVCATDGADALVQLAGTSTLPRLILLDLRMPVMPGWHFRTRQSATPGWAAIPVVVLSASPMLADQLLPPATAVIAKPLDLDALLVIAQQYCRRVPADSACPQPAAGKHE